MPPADTKIGIVHAKQVPTKTTPEFVAELDSRIQKMAKKIYGRMGNLGDKLEEMLADETEDLRTFKWKDAWPYIDYDTGELTILDSVMTGTAKLGLVRNIQSDFQNDSEGWAQVLNGTSPIAAIELSTAGIDYLQAHMSANPSPDATMIMLDEAAIATLTAKYAAACDTDALARLQAAVAANPTGVPAVSMEELTGTEALSQQFAMSDRYIIQYAQPNFPVMRGSGEYGGSTTSGSAGMTSKVNWRSCRTMIRGYESGKLLQQAGLVLNIAVAAQRKQSAWMYWRLGPMINLEKFFQAIINWIESTAKAIQAIIDTILEYIDYIQQRIYEIQSLIRKINAIIQSIFLFEIPAGYVSFFYSNGTDGLLMDFMSAENKPTDAPTAWGACALAVVPLIPYSEWLLGLLFPEVFGEETAETTGGEAAT